MLMKNIRLILVMLAVVLMYGRMWFTGTWRMIQMILIWTAILGMMIVVIVGCGSDDSPIKEEMPQLSIEAPNPYVPLVLGTWRLQTVTWLEKGVVNQSIDFSSGLFTLTFKPDKTFEVIYRYPIEEAISEILRPAEWEDIQEIIVTFPGKYGISKVDPLSRPK